ncbi:MAG: UDP-N-acetylmuramoyl-tripeptide--D-alanyl-D-alanine ligase [Candidatus Omnitrophica bacterium]|nr:UDP-N-acetylmuramoyl-tripeptide--D-alanyl-D-alanine ligase [Candidatus Omnitrophota bacterium]
MYQLNEFITRIHGSLISSPGVQTITGISIDTRTIKPGDCFFAIRGAHFDGHSFLDEAYKKGASASVVDHASWSKRVKHDDAEYVTRMRQLPNVIVVHDTIQSLGLLASSIREGFGGICVGITGSCGKTTTKEYVSLVLGTRYTVMSNCGNYNNAIGLPLTLLNVTEAHKALVCEMGAAQQGDIAYLSHILKPTVGIITNVHPAHLETFKTLENVYRTKLELAEYLDSINGTLIINGDDEKLIREARKYHVSLITVGRSAHCDFVLTNTECTDRKITFVVNSKYTFTINTIAHFNVYNALAALALADFCQISFTTLTGIFTHYEELNGRFKIYGKDTLIIDDTYNANPFSFSQSLQAFRKIKVQRKKIVVCGDMLELGPDSKKFHRELGKELIDAGANVVVALGDLTAETIKAIEESNADIRCVNCENNKAAIDFLKSELVQGDAVLLKGSRGMKLEEIAGAL